MSILTRYSEPRHRPPIGRDGRVLVAQPRGILRFNGSAQALVKRVGAIATEALSVKHRVGGGPRVKRLNHEIPAASPAALLPMVRTQVQGAGSWYEEAPTQASPPRDAALYAGRCRTSRKGPGTDRRMPAWRPHLWPR